MGRAVWSALRAAVARVLTAEPARATASHKPGAVDPVDVHAAQAIAICNGRPQVAVVKGHRR